MRSSRYFWVFEAHEFSHVVRPDMGMAWVEPESACPVGQRSLRVAWYFQVKMLAVDHP